MFQDVDYARLRPVRYTELTHHMEGLFAIGTWLVVTDTWNDTVMLYSLPGLALHDKLRVMSCHHPQADSDGAVYVPGYKYIAVLEITDSGELTAIRNLSSVAGQSLQGTLAVAVGPQPGQLCVAQWSLGLWVVNASDGSVVQALTVPDQCRGLSSVAALDSGQLLISCYCKVSWDTYILAVYRSAADFPTLLTNLTSVDDRVLGLRGRGNNFLAPYYYKGEILVLGADGSVLHKVDAVSGKLGVLMYEITDVAVWEDCVWLGAWWGDLVLLCAN